MEIFKKNQQAADHTWMHFAQEDSKHDEPAAVTVNEQWKPFI